MNKFGGSNPASLNTKTKLNKPTGIDEGLFSYIVKAVLLRQVWLYFKPTMKKKLLKMLGVPDSMISALSNTDFDNMPIKYKSQLGKLIEQFSNVNESTDEAVTKTKAGEMSVIQKKDNGKWGIISNKTGKFWDADYDTKEKAQAALKAYHVHSDGFGNDTIVMESMLDDKSIAYLNALNWGGVVEAESDRLMFAHKLFVDKASHAYKVNKKAKIQNVIGVREEQYISESATVYEVEQSLLRLDESKIAFLKTTYGIVDEANANTKQIANYIIKNLRANPHLLVMYLAEFAYAGRAALQAITNLNEIELEVALNAMSSEKQAILNRLYGWVNESMPITMSTKLVDMTGKIIQFNNGRKYRAETKPVALHGSNLINTLTLQELGTNAAPIIASDREWLIQQGAIILDESNSWLNEDNAVTFSMKASELAGKTIQFANGKKYIAGVKPMALLGHELVNTLTLQEIGTYNKPIQVSDREWLIQQGATIINESSIASTDWPSIWKSLGWARLDIIIKFAKLPNSQFSYDWHEISKEWQDKLKEQIVKLYPQFVNENTADFNTIWSNTNKPHRKVLLDETLTRTDKAKLDNYVNLNWFALPNYVQGRLKSHLSSKYDLDESELGMTLAEQIKHAEQITNTNPTEAQIKSGCYGKGSINIQGLKICIENPKGSVRSGKDASGKEWSITMNNTYGYISKTESKDGDEIDIFLANNPASDKVYVIDQVNKDGSFDEHKVIIGADSLEEAKSAYLSNYEDGWTGLGAITETTMLKFKEWMSTDKSKQPFASSKIDEADNDIDIKQAEQIYNNLSYDAKINLLIKIGMPALQATLAATNKFNYFVHAIQVSIAKNINLMHF